MPRIKIKDQETPGRVDGTPPPGPAATALHPLAVDIQSESRTEPIRVAFQVALGEVLPLTGAEYWPWIPFDLDPMEAKELADALYAECEKVASKTE